MTRTGPNGVDHILTVSLEEYFQVGSFKRVVQQRQWYRFESRLEHSTRRALDLLAEMECTATFFVLGWIAERMPELVRAVAERGHEIADRGYFPRALRDLTPDEFRDDLQRSREVIQAATGCEVVGHRSARLWGDDRHLWALEVLAREGYGYDASFAPLGRNPLSRPDWRVVHRHSTPAGPIWEVPVSSIEVLGLTFPSAGGNYLRQLPAWCARTAFRRWSRAARGPFVMYFNVWELDTDQPRLAGGPLASLRHYRNLDRMPGRLRSLLRLGRFGSAADYLGLARQPLLRPALPATTPPSGLPAAPAAAGTPVTIVVPCFNEDRVIPYLANTLDSVAAELAGRYRLSFVFVDDGSTDATREQLDRSFGHRADSRVISHDRNRGIAGAIRTGIEAAGTEIVCSIDCDCSYDPHELGRMIPLLGPDVALVTASPYHPDGGVWNVPGWRLFLSRSVSRLYALVLHHGLRTYTSCFRVYRRSAVLATNVRQARFLGIVEQLAAIDLSGGRIVEFPTVLEARLLGQSKLKVVRTILAHLGLLARLAGKRLGLG